MALKAPTFDHTPRESQSEAIFGGRYKYVDLQEGFFAGVKHGILRVVAPLNPFAVSQVTDDNHIGFAPKVNGGFKPITPYPNSVSWARYMVPHFDLTSNPDVTSPSPLNGGITSPALDSTLVRQEQPLPKACTRQVTAFKRCKMINGVESCGDEVKNLMEICPTWALESLKEGKRFKAKVQAIQNAEYKQAMSVPEYNAGRTVSDISGKTYVHGTRKYLRPDTLWADERYRTVDQAEINEAKKRYEARSKSHISHDAHNHEHDVNHHDYAFKGAKKPLYY